MPSRVLETIKEEDPRFVMLVLWKILLFWEIMEVKPFAVKGLFRSRASKPSSEIVYAAEQGDLDRVERILKIMPHMVNRNALWLHMTWVCVVFLYRTISIALCSVEQE